MFERFVLSHWKKWVLLYLLFLIGAVYLYKKLPVLTSTAALIPKDKEFGFYQKFRQQFGADDGLIIAFKHPNLFSKQVLFWIRNLTDKLSNLDGVESVLSITNADDFLGQESDFIVEPLVPTEIPNNQAELKYIHDRALSNALIKGNLVNYSGNATLLLIRTKNHFEKIDYDEYLVNAVKETLEGMPELPGLGNNDIKIAGWPVLDVNMAQYMNRDLKFFVPVTIIMMGIILFSFFRCVRLTIAILITMIFSLIFTMATLKLVGGAMSPMTAILSPLIMALSIADGIHFCSLLPANKANRSIEDQIVSSANRLYIPCFLTSLTTAIGFLSLLFSHIPSIRHFGSAAAAGMLIEYILSFTMLPILLLLLFKLKTNQSITGRLVYSQVDGKKIPQGLSNLIVRYRFTILVFFGAISAGCLFLIPKINVETDLINYFPTKSSLVNATKFIDKFLGGTNTIEFSFKSKVNDIFLEPEILARLDHLGNLITKEHAVTKIIGVNEFLKQMNKAFHNEQDEFFIVPTSRQLVAQYLLLYNGDELSYFINDDRSWVRLSARTTTHSSRELTQLMEKSMQNALKLFENLKKDIKIRITGKTYLVNRMIREIVASQIKSLAFAGLIIFGIIFLLLRSWMLGLVALLVNLVPLLLNFGTMVMLNIPLNTATAIISAVALGIAVDDTIHFLTEFKKVRGLGYSIEKAIEASLVVKGKAALITSVVMIGAYGILTFSNYVPTAQFGLLSALIMAWALAADCILAPALLSFFEKE